MNPLKIRYFLIFLEICTVFVVMGWPKKNEPFFSG